MKYAKYKLTDEQKRELDRIADSFMEHTNYKLTDEPLSFATEEELDKAQIKAENLEIELEN